VLLFVDTFTNYFAHENALAACKVLEAAGYTVHTNAVSGTRPLCCGRTFLSAGMVGEAKSEARRTLDALLPYVKRGVAVVGLEPSCLLGLRDEFLDYGLGADAQLLAANALLFEEFLVREKAVGRFALALKKAPASDAIVHGHCHQKAFAAMKPMADVLGWIPGMTARFIDSSCCGMAGAFGYEAQHYDISMAMGELALLPAARAAAATTLIIADGFSCRHQIRDGAGRNAQHVARVLELALARSP
jgi:Fe-S oxidoreductase